MTEFEKELVRFVSGYFDAGISAEDYVKAFSQRLLNSIGQQSKPKASEDVEEAAENYAYGESNDKYQGFVDEASWHKGQMMKESVDATVIAMKSGDKYCQAYITDRNSLANMCNGDHVKLIIVKEVK